MRAAVIGHVEWVTFLEIDRPPAPGIITHASLAWDEPAGGGGVAAAELARLAGRSTFYTALAGDDAGRSSAPILSRLGVEVLAAPRPAPQRRAVVMIDPSGERTIIVHGPSLAPAVDDPLPFDALDATDCVYFCKGDAGVLRLARRARVLVATARILPIIQAAGVELDALVRSAHDAGERYAPGDLDPPPRAVVATEGAAGGTWETRDGARGRWTPVPPPGEPKDAYGAGDSFAAGLAYALARGDSIQQATELAAARGALALTRRGAHGVVA